jgi:hypothetical protein
MPDQNSGRPSSQFTPKQGQYLAYIHLYRKLHHRGPSESEIREYFRVSPPTVRQMIVTLEKRGGSLFGRWAWLGRSGWRYRLANCQGWKTTKIARFEPRRPMVTGRPPPHVAIGG